MYCDLLKLYIYYKCNFTGTCFQNLVVAIKPVYNKTLLGPAINGAYGLRYLFILSHIKSGYAAIYVVGIVNINIRLY